MSYGNHNKMKGDVTVMGFILITIVIIAALAMFSGNKTKKSAKAKEQRKFERKMEREFNTGTRESSMEFNTGTRESSSQAYNIDLAKSWSSGQVKEYS